MEYEFIELKNDIIEEFTEYIEDLNYNISQATARVIEESIRLINNNEYYRSIIYSYIAIVSLENNKIIDFIYQKIKKINNDDFLIKLKELFGEKDFYIFQNDLINLKKVINNKNYEIIEFDESFKNRLDSIIKNNFII